MNMANSVSTEVSKPFQSSENIGLVSILEDQQFNARRIKRD
jgi:hypothetical protein